MTFFSIYSTDSLDFVDKEINYKSGDYLKGTKYRNLSCPLHARWCIRKTVLKVQTADWKIAWYLKKNKLYYHLESKTQPSTEQSVALSSSVAYEKLIHKLHNRLNIFEVA